MVKSSCSLNIELIPDTRLITATLVNMGSVYNWDVKGDKDWNKRLNREREDYSK
jgi:hypothetical protein